MVQMSVRHPSGPIPTEPGSARRRWTLAAVAAVGLVVAVGLVWGINALAGGGDRPSRTRSQGAATTPSASPHPSSQGSTPPSSAPTATSLADSFSAAGVKAAYVQILQRREDAYRRGDPTSFTSIYAAGCPCLDADRQSLQAAKSRGLRFEGPPVQVRSVTVASLDRQLHTASLVAQVHYGTSRFVDANGTAVIVEKDKGIQTFQVILVWDGYRWLVAQTTEVGGTG